MTSQGVLLSCGSGEARVAGFLGRAVAVDRGTLKKGTPLSKVVAEHQVLEVVQKELKTLRPLRRKRGGAEGARDTGVQTTTAALTEGATQTDNTRPSIRNANTQTDVVEAPPPPPPEAEAPAAENTSLTGGKDR